MKINAKDIMEYVVLKKKEYTEKHGNGISSTGIDNAMDTDKIDYTTLGESRERLIVMTKKTKAFTPRKDAGKRRR